MKFRLLAVLVLVTGCGQDGPPTVRYGQEGCALCRMIVNDDRYACAIVTTSGDTHKFDDVCCLLDYLTDHPGTERQVWVRGYQSKGWHDARTAYFAYGPKLQTPMGSGLAAVATRAEADALAKDWGGQALRYDELPAFLKAQK